MRLKLQQANHPEKISLLYGLAITYDDGVRWQRLAQALRDSSYSLDPSDLAGGDECRFSVFATDGFNTTYRDSKTFSLLIQPPMIVPLNFEENCEVLAGEPVLFEVEAISARFGSLDGDQINWTLDGEEIGTGREMWIELDEGVHQLTVRAESSPTCIEERMFRIKANPLKKVTKNEID